MSKAWVPSVRKRNKQTLLEQALAFRKSNPERWQAREEEVQEVAEEDPKEESNRSSYIEEYYNEMIQIKKEKELKATKVNVV